MLKKILSIALSVLLIVSIFSSCTSQVNTDDSRLSIVTTIFPLYDFVRQIAGDKINVMMLIPPGVESHSYEPTPADIIEIENADMFFFISEHTETWVTQLTSAVKNKSVQIMGVAELIGIEIHGHNHEHDHLHDDSEAHNCETDEHIWTNLEYAASIVTFLGSEIAKLNTENKDFYLSNAKSYSDEILRLRDDFSAMISDSARRKIVSGSRFAMKNFANEFGLDFVAAFDSCVDNTQPSAGVMAKIINEIKNENIPVVFYEELTEPKIARAVSAETGAKMLLLHSCHNVSAKELKDGATYVSLMKINYNNLKEALN